MDELNIELIREDTAKQEAFIMKYKPFILNCASNYFKRYITDSDEEWSIALQAFVESINKYHSDKGSFLCFARLVIRRKLIDYLNSNKKYQNEIPINPFIFDGEFEEDEDNTSVYIQVQRQLTYTPENYIVEEIETINKVFLEYGFSFFNLTKCSPKSDKTKIACANVILLLLKNPIFINEIKRTKRIPIKIIEKNTKLPRKTIERHRNYIIAGVEILSGEYPFLAKYMQHITKELNK